MYYTEEFLEKLRAAFGEDDAVTEAVERCYDYAERYLDDNTPSSIHYGEVLSATSFEDLRAMAEHIQLMNEVRSEFKSGKCYASDDVRREKVGCPRLYGQKVWDREILCAFPCDRLPMHTPFQACPKFKSGKCWKKFDELGLIAK